MNQTTRVIVAVVALFMVVEAAGIAYLGHEIAKRNFSDKEARTQELADYRGAMQKEMEQRFTAEHREAAIARDAIEKQADTATNIATKALAKSPSAMTLSVKTPLPVRVVTAQVTPTQTTTPTVTPTPDTNPKRGGVLNSIFGTP